MQQKTNIQAKYDGKYTKLPKQVLPVVHDNALKVLCEFYSTQYPWQLKNSSLALELDIHRNYMTGYIDSLKDYGLISANKEPVDVPKDFVMIPQSAHRILSSKELLVLAHIISKKSDQYWNFRDVRIAQELNLGVATVKRALTTLEAMNILKRTKTEGRRMIYELLPYEFPNLRISLFDKCLASGLDGGAFSIFLCHHNRYYKQDHTPLKDSTIEDNVAHIKYMFDEMGVILKDNNYGIICKKFLSSQKGGDYHFPVFVRWVAQQLNADRSGFDTLTTSELVECSEFSDALYYKLIG